ncbi:MAG: energy transducer TonB [Pseudomonadota bacterium]
MSTAKTQVRTPLPLPARLLGAFAGACCVVLSLSLFASWLIKLFDEREDDGIESHPVELLVGYSSLDLAELLGEPRHQLPELAPPPPPVALAPRTVSGFVMLEVDVDEHGRARDARIIEATPPGVYEQQAVREALAAEYPAGSPGVRDSLVRFSVPAEAPPDPN